MQLLRSLSSGQVRAFRWTLRGPLSILHFLQKSAIIEASGLQNDIVESRYQPEHAHNFHVGIRKNLSPQLQAKLTRIITEGLAAGDFAHIRTAYYSENQSVQIASFK